MVSYRRRRSRRSLNRLTIRFKQAVDVADLGRLPGVQVLSNSGPFGVTLQVTGDMEVLMQSLGCLPVLTLETERPSLEEVFLTYYQK